MYKIQLYIAVLPATPRKTEKRYSYRLSCLKNGEEKALENTGTREDATYHETTLTAIAEGLKRLNQSCEVHLYCEDGFVLKMIETNLSKWQANDFKTAKGVPVANEEGWREYWKLSRGQLIKLHRESCQVIEQMKEELKRRQYQ